MSKKYESLAGTIVEKVGGSGNISAVRHCQTRLRFTLRDTGKADKEGRGGRKTGSEQGRAGRTGQSGWQKNVAGRLCD